MQDRYTVTGIVHVGNQLALRAEGLSGSRRARVSCFQQDLTEFSAADTLVEVTDYEDLAQVVSSRSLDGGLRHG